MSDPRDDVTQARIDAERAQGGIVPSNSTIYHIGTGDPEAVIPLNIDNRTLQRLLGAQWPRRRPPLKRRWKRTFPKLD